MRLLNCLVTVRTALPKAAPTGIASANDLKPFFNPYSFIYHPLLL